MTIQDGDDCFGADFLTETCFNATLAKFLLLQSGPLNEFGPLDEGDQIEILLFEVSIFGIKIVAQVGEGIERTFYLRAERIEKSELV
jgi:hypothetical protein